MLFYCSQSIITIPSQISHYCSIPLVHYANIAISDSTNTLLVYGPYHTNSTHDVITVTLDTLEHDMLYHMTLSDQTVGGVSNAVPIEMSESMILLFRKLSGNNFSHAIKNDRLQC